MLTRQSDVSLDSLNLPSCALSCFLKHILHDGCVDDTDFDCHCAAGNLLQTASACISQGCDKAEQDDAFAKVSRGCQEVLRDGVSRQVILVTSVSSRKVETLGPDVTSSTVANTVPTVTVATRTGSPACPGCTGSPSTILSRTKTSSFPQPTDSALVSPTPSVPPMREATPTPVSTDSPVPPISQSGLLSDGAKAGLAAGFMFMLVSAFLGLGWYIRRLKRKLRVVQQIASKTPDDAASTYGEEFNPMEPIHRTRQPSWTRGSIGSSNGPMSPFIPQLRSTEEITTMTANYAGASNAPYPHVLSIVIEQEEEDSSSIKEPVPGQKEGLSGPLELDGAHTGLFEMPLAVTPRGSSMEQGRDGQI
ncbi:GPI anchored CFEM domain protein [Pyrenophora tritici-repentis]|nr:CFEM domain-containing protein [Pyrenophora tritici-repentis]KAF7452164.1 CFEM domain containing protein [Pyrenophora tritici-repentis]KAG9386509.1 CFEM domain containing protein [Pyrenophora tritici-repentis]KAI0586923.1 CFEM domain-containing protein [Pyrenophora tritici-repentis]KAI0589765.1 CFEM domain-containing protein [Pyrenophora tritici-repentis]